MELLSNVIILKHLSAGEEFLKFDGKSVLILVFIFIQQLNDNLLDENISQEIFKLVETLLRLLGNFFKEEIYECLLNDFDIIFFYLNRFLEKVKNKILLLNNFDRFL